jgi:phage-related protein
MAWIVETLNATVDAEIERLPADMRASLQRIVELIETYGLEHVREPYLKHLRGALWEMRLKGRSGVARAIYVTAIGQRVVIVRAFVKKSAKAPARELDLALARSKEVR